MWYRERWQECSAWREQTFALTTSEPADHDFWEPTPEPISQTTTPKGTTISAKTVVEARTMRHEWHTGGRHWDAQHRHPP